MLQELNIGHVHQNIISVSVPDGKKLHQQTRYTKPHRASRMVT